MSHAYPIYVCNQADSPQYRDLAGILECLLPVKFVYSPAGGTQWAGEILTDDAKESVEVDSMGASSSLSVPSRRTQPVNGGPNDITVTFTDNPDVPFPFRGRSLRSRVSAGVKILSLRNGERILAGSEHGAVWVMSKKGNTRHFRTGFVLPEIAPGAGLKDVLNGEHFLEMLPLLHWLHEICADAAYDGPPLRACFIFDDPNLHWPRYGFVDYEQIGRQAVKENYHVSFATIPLDAWFAHEATTQVFRNNVPYLSLAVHGNNHTKQELARNYTPSARVSLLQQAIRRIEHLEARTGLSVCRVMVPPHGACSEEMLAELPGCGFEAACISHGSMRAHNQGKAWTRNVGYFPSELVHGCPVLPRWGLSGNVKNTILLAAFLGQPMVLRGHHQDLKDGIELLDNLAEFINQLGPVTWSRMTDLCRMNHQWRMEGSTCRVKPLGRRIVFRIPEPATRLVIEDGFRTDWQISGMNGNVTMVRAGENIALSERSRGEISIVAAPAATVPSTNGTHRTTAPVFLRRLLTEGRDRLLPLSRIR
jgi:hypothetical protein